AGLTADIWVISAGYGLVSQRAHVHSYSATFGRAYVDRVANGTRDTVDSMNRAWWEQLIVWPGPERASRSLGMLAREDPSAGLLMIASSDYIRAVEKDLLTAAEQLDDPRRLIVVSSHEMAAGRLSPHVICSDAKLQARLGGALTSLHARVGR